MTHPLLLVSERIVSRDKGMHPAEVLFIIMHIQLEKSNCCIGRRIRRWKELILFIFKHQNFVWNFSYCSIYITYCNCKDIYTKCCAPINDIKSSSVFFPTAQRNVTGLCWAASRHSQSTKWTVSCFPYVSSECSLVTCLRFPFQGSVSYLLFLYLGATFSTASFALSLSVTRLRYCGNLFRKTA